MSKEMREKFGKGYVSQEFIDNGAIPEVKPDPYSDEEWIEIEKTVMAMSGTDDSWAPYSAKKTAIDELRALYDMIDEEDADLMWIKDRTSRVLETYLSHLYGTEDVINAYWDVIAKVESESILHLGMSYVSSALTDEETRGGWNICTTR